MLRLADQHTVVPVKIIDRVPFINVYVYVGTDKPRSLQLATPPSKWDLQEVHEIMGCTSEELLKKTLKVVDGLPQHVAKQKLHTCPICPAAKGRRLPILRDESRPPREYAKRQAVALDTSARQPPSIQGAEYVQLIVEFVSKYIVAQLLKCKSDATEAFREYIVKFFPPDFVQTRRWW